MCNLWPFEPTDGADVIDSAGDCVDHTAAVSTGPLIPFEHEQSQIFHARPSFVSAPVMLIPEQLFTFELGVSIQIRIDKSTLAKSAKL